MLKNRKKKLQQLDRMVSGFIQFAVCFMLTGLWTLEVTSQIVFRWLYEGVGVPRKPAEAMIQCLDALASEELLSRQHQQNSMMRMGVTFNVYSDKRGVKNHFRLFDYRIITGREWFRVEKGLKQRIKALNLFISDLYLKQSIIKDGVIPKKSSAGFRKQCMGMRPARDIWTHITGSDLVRHSDGQIYI